MATTFSHDWHSPINLTLYYYCQWCRCFSLRTAQDKNITLNLLILVSLLSGLIWLMHSEEMHWMHWCHLTNTYYTSDALSNVDVILCNSATVHWWLWCTFVLRLVHCTVGASVVMHWSTVNCTAVCRCKCYGTLHWVTVDASAVVHCTVDAGVQCTWYCTDVVV